MREERHLADPGGDQDSNTAESDTGCVWTYIEDMLGELAGMASANGAHTLATAITMAALEAARSAPRRSDEA
jgi:hypothetical protein